MNVKNYRAKSADECMQKLKADMGRDAVILQSRTVRPFLGRFGPAMHEIVAASDVSTVLDQLGARRSVEVEAPAVQAQVVERPVAAPRGPSSGRMTLAEAAEQFERSGGMAALLQGGSLNTAVAPRPAAVVEEDRIGRLEKQIAQLAEMFARSQAAPPKVVASAGPIRYAKADEQATAAPHPAPAAPADADPYLSVLDGLRRAQVAEPLVRRLRADLVEGLSPDDARQSLHDALARRLLIAPGLSATPGKMTIAALMGPTGVGKTTTIAKLAASLSLSQGLSVAMITLDTQRVAATAQLQTYGDILQAPVRIAYDKAELETHLAEFAASGTAVVLIDTPGRGPSETLPLAEMSTSLRSIVDLKTYLVIPATLSASNFDSAIVRFTKLAQPTAMILSKMDETADNQCLGFTINAQARYKLPLAYVTCGSRVPDDLLLADAHVLASKILAAA